MKTYYKRTITVDNEQVTRNVTEKHGQATINHKGQVKPVTPSGNPLDKQTVWTVKSTAQA
jgi:hypothetical protein